MMHYASKLFWLVAQPLSLAFVLVALGLLLGLFRRRRLATGSFLAAALLLFVTLFTTTGAVLLQPLEDRFARAGMPAGGPACIVVLGGGIEAEVITARGGFEMNQAGDRFIETLRLAREFPGARILISGGDGSLSGTYAGDAGVAAQFLETFGIGPERLIREGDSRTTFENVVNTKDLLAENGLDSCLLVTSAFHMPRSVGLFRKAGLEPLPWPTDYRTTGTARLAFDFTQPSINSQLTTTAVREWTGLLAYYLAGRIDAVFPE